MFLKLDRNLTRIFTQPSLSAFENFREPTVQVWDNVTFADNPLDPRSRILPHPEWGYAMPTLRYFPILYLQTE